MKKRNIFLILAILCMVAFVIGCTSETPDDTTEPTPTPNGTAAQTPEPEPEPTSEPEPTPDQTPETGIVFPSRGRITDDLVYINEYLGLQISFPETIVYLDIARDDFEQIPDVLFDGFSAYFEELRVMYTYGDEWYEFRIFFVELQPDELHLTALDYIAAHYYDMTWDGGSVTVEVNTTPVIIGDIEWFIVDKTFTENGDTELIRYLISVSDGFVTEIAFDGAAVVDFIPWISAA